MAVKSLKFQGLEGGTLEFSYREVKEGETWYQCPALHLLEGNNIQYGGQRLRHSLTNGVRQLLHLHIHEKSRHMTVI